MKSNSTQIKNFEGSSILAGSSKHQNSQLIHSDLRRHHFGVNSGETLPHQTHVSTHSFGAASNSNLRDIQIQANA
jgi:hypothetical protein